MANLKIRIETGVERSGDGQDNLERDITKREKEKTALVSLLAHQAIAQGKKILNYSISNIGNFTGDYTKTEAIQTTLGIVGDMATIGVGAATGPAGAFIAVAGVAVSRGLEAVSYFQDMKHKEIETEYLKQRSGNSLINGSRGTED